MTDKKTIEEVLTSDNGLLTNIGRLYDLDFADADRLAIMDEDYIEVYSGLKTVSRIVEKNTVDGVVNIDKLAKIVGNRYYNKWNKVWEGFIAEYDFLDNYDITEEEKTDRELDDTNTVEETKTKAKTVEGTKEDNQEVDLTETAKNTKTDTRTMSDTSKDEKLTNIDDTENSSLESNENRSGSVDEKTGLYGFNSSNPSDADKLNRSTADETTGSSTGSKTKNSVIDDTINRTGSMTTDISLSEDIEKGKNGTTKTTSTDSRTENDSDTKNGSSTKKTLDNIVRTLTRKGNNGAVNKTKLQEQYLRLHTLWGDFCKIVYSDIDDILTTYTYTLEV